MTFLYTVYLIYVLKECAYIEKDHKAYNAKFRGYLDWNGE